MVAEGFLNMLMVLGPHTARGNIPQAIEHSVDFQAGILSFMQEYGYTRVETQSEHLSEWTETVIQAAERLLSSKVVLADRDEPQRKGPECAPRAGV
jgi:hypothetical protein